MRYPVIISHCYLYNQAIWRYSLDMQTRVNRKRKTIKWLGSAACLLVLGTWLASAFWSFSIFYGYEMSLGSMWGTIALRYKNHLPTERQTQVGADPPPRFSCRIQSIPPLLGTGGNDWRLRWHATRIQFGLRWQAIVQKKRENACMGDGYYCTEIRIPYWGIFLVVLPITLVCWFADRRFRPPHCCPACGYDLTGNVSGRCPECGRLRHTA